MQHRWSPAPWLVAVLIGVSACGAPTPTGQRSGAVVEASATPASHETPRPSRATPVPATPVPVACPEPLAAPPVATPDPIASPAVDGVLAMYADVSIVAIGERHGWSLQHDLFAQLVCDPRFAETVDDIVVEFGNARLQPILDAYVNGDEVTAAELASVWRESTQRSGVWEDPVYVTFFGLIRSVNAHLPADDRIRVLAGDPPIDYRTVTDFSECSDQVPTCYDYWIQRRDQSFTEVVAREVIAKGRTALLIAGAGHFMRREGPEQPPSIAQILEANHATRTFVVVPHLGFGAADPVSEARFDGWPVPGLARLDGNWLASLDACLLEADLGSPPTEPCESGQAIGDAADAYLYLGYP